MQIAITDRKKLVQAYYDVTAPVYDHKHGVSGAGQEYNFEQYYEPFLRQSVPRNTRVLEIGCGTGAYTRWLVEQGCEVTALDISAEMVNMTRSRCPGATALQADCECPAEHLPTEKSSAYFDALVGINSFSYYPNKPAALRAYHALLRPGGRIVLIDMNGSCPLYRVMKWIRKNEMPQWFSEIRQMRDSNLSRMLNDSGFNLRELTHFCFVPNGVSRAAARLLRPIDRLLGLLPPMSRWAMRVALVAERA